MKDSKVAIRSLKFFLSKHFQAILVVMFTVVIMSFVTTVNMANSHQSEHESHHPQSPAMPDTSTAGMKPKSGMPNDTSKNMGGRAKAGMGTGGGGMGDMMKGMGEMMKGMGKSGNKDLYPSMMEFPELPTEKRNQIIKLANQRVNEADALLLSGMEDLKVALLNHDFAATQEANNQIKQGQKVLESSLATQLTIAENRSPKTTALRWFKQNLNIDQIVETDNSEGLFGLSWFHYISMLSLVAFVIAMIWMYFQKMKRADSLVEKLSGNATPNTPPPGGDKAGGAAPVPNKADVKPTEVPADKVDAKPVEPPTGKVEASPAMIPDYTPSKPNSWTGTLLVAEIFVETPNVKTFRLTEPEGKKIPFNFLPGQFITVTINPTGVPVKRSYTIASSPTHTDCCEITVKHEEKGTVSHYMHNNVHIGELMQFTAPSGKFTFTESHAKSAVFIGGGVGLTPMMSATRYLTDRSWKGDIYFFLSCKNENSIIFREELLYLGKRYPNLHIYFVLSQQQGEAKVDFIPGHITKEVISERVPDIASRMVHICGPKPMMDAVKQMMDELKVPKENVMQEVFSGAPPIAKTPPPATDAPIKPPDGKETEQPASTEDGKAAVPENGQSAAPEAEKAVAPEESKGGIVTFAKSSKTAVLTADKTVLEASEEVGVNIDYSCRVGTCGVCISKLLSGNVTMAVQDALTEADKQQNMILVCQAKATEDISVDA